MTLREPVFASTANATRVSRRSSQKPNSAMRVCERFPNSPARATTVLGLEHFRATADGGVLALSFVTALLARPWKVDTLGGRREERPVITPVVAHGAPVRGLSSRQDGCGQRDDREPG